MMLCVLVTRWLTFALRNEAVLDFIKAIEKHAEVRFVREGRHVVLNDDVFCDMSNEAVTEAGVWLNDQAWWVW